MPINNPTGSGVKIFTSAPQIYSNGGALTIPHGLGVKPSIVVFKLRCSIAEGGYAVGDEIQVAPIGYDTSNYVSSIFIDTADVTNIKVRFASAGGMFISANKTTGATFVLNPVNWRLYITAMA